jgi:hypothetical protein
MPGDGASATPWYVRLAENPVSPIAFPGAVDLFGHDCIHLLLGRGTHLQDEAFVIGVTMGASGRLDPWRRHGYLLWARCAYRGPYRLRRDRLVFDIGVEFGRNGRTRPLHNVAWRDMLDHPLGELRAAHGIDVDDLLTIYESERVLWPASPAGRRLPRRSAMTAVDPG